MKRCCEQVHCTLAEFEKLSPWEQGYIVYWQAEHPGSELKEHQKNPYPKGSTQWQEFNAGERAAVIAAQDSEE